MLLYTEFLLYVYDNILYVCLIQTPPTTYTLLDNRLVMLPITSMQQWWQWVDTHTQTHICTHTYASTHAPKHTHTRTHTYTHMHTAPCSVELLKTSWVCSCPGSTWVYQDWCLGADLAIQDQEHCTAVPTEGKEDGKQDATLCCRISCCSDKDYIMYVL